jgi:beta-lactamase regulating signal transducer with metallopeptidase domain
MMMTWIACAAVFGLLAALAAHLAERALPPSAARRHIWSVALALSVAVPALALAAPGLWSFAPRLVSVPAAVSLAEMPVTFAGDVGAALPAAQSTSTGWSMALVLGLVWALLSALFLAVYTAVWLRFIGAAGEWRPHRIGDQRVRIATRTGPAVFGLRRPTIVLPEWVLQADAAVQRMIMLHELEHARARDHVLLGLAPLALVLMPWNLPIWWQVHRLRLAVEVDCDRRVLRHGVALRDYGSLLIDIAQRSAPMPAALAALAEPRSILERRILAMSNRTTPRVRSRIALGAAAALLVLTGAETFALLAPPADAAQQPVTAAAAPATDVAEITAAAEATREEILRARINEFGLAADTPLVVIDGVILRGADMERALRGREVVNLEVVAGDAAILRFGERAASGVMVITTAELRPSRAVVASPTAGTTTTVRSDEARAVEARAANATAVGRVNNVRIISRDTLRATAVRGKVPFTVDAVTRADEAKVSSSSEITPESVYLDRRRFLRLGAAGAGVPGGAGRTGRMHPVGHGDAGPAWTRCRTN